MRYPKKCNKCMLHESANHHTCIRPRGNLTNPSVLLIGEAPGGTEDRTGEAFTGEAGKVLDFIVDKLGLSWKDIACTNCLRCRPPNNKLPAKTKGLTECWEACRVYLMKEIADMKPKTIVLMGNTPLNLLGEKKLISRWERRWLSYDFIASYHPAACLRRPSHEAKIGTAIAMAAKKAGLKVRPKEGMYDGYRL